MSDHLPEPPKFADFRRQNGFVTFEGRVLQSSRLASGTSDEKPFGEKGTLEWQDPYFLERGVDFEELIGAKPFPGTINVGIGEDIELDRSYSGPHVIDVPGFEWFYEVDGEVKSIKEDFKIIQSCMVIYGAQAYRGVLYYPDPLTKPPTNEHKYDRIEVRTTEVPLAYGDGIRVLIPDGIFKPRVHVAPDQEHIVKAVQNTGGPRPPRPGG